MQFISGAKRVSEIRYVVRRNYEKRSASGDLLERVPSVVAEFNRHLFDSVEAQRKNKWSDETREMVENYLLDHEDYGKVDGTGFYRADGQNPDPIVVDGEGCSALVNTGDGMAKCGKPAVSENPSLCAEHAEENVPVGT